jgi:hypothetical protein
MKMTFKTIAIAASTFACATVLSLGLSTTKAEAHRLYVSPHYAVHAVYHHAKDLPWYAVRAYYWNGPWTGTAAAYYSWNGWSDYAAQNGIGCVPGTGVKGGDGIWYVCQ